MWQRAEVISVTDQTADFRSIVLKPEKFTNFKSGNFIELAVNQDEAFKCYSVVSSPHQSNIIEVGVKLYEGGAVSPQLFALKNGDFVLMRGPMGAYFIWEASEKETILIAGGSGICPMISILRQYTPGIGNLYIIYSSKKGSVYYKDELQSLCKSKNIDLSIIETGASGRINKEFLKNKFEEHIDRSADFFVAGPSEFVQDVSYWLGQLGVRPEHLKTDDFGA